MTDTMPRYRDLPEVTKTQARAQLKAWAQQQRAADLNRAPAVLMALKAGIPATEIHELTGLARTTISRIARETDQ